MTKKTLIELMLENDVKWKAQATHACQDKNMKLSFYTEKPFRFSGDNEWHYKGYMISSRVELPELCRNWHQTIVTREQYEAAQVKRNAANRITDGLVPSKCIGKLHVDLQVSDIISQIANHQAESQRHEEAMLDHNDKELALRDQLNEMLAKVGMMVVDAEPNSDKSEWPDYCDENGIVTGCWSRLPVGAKVECISANGNYVFYPGKVYEVGKDEKKGITGPLDEDGETTNFDISMSLVKFRLIK